MYLIAEIPLLNQLLDQYRPVIGADYEGYKNHCYRVLNFMNLLARKRQLAFNPNEAAIALAFHDLGIWTNHTVAYIEPSVELARKYVRAHNSDLEHAASGDVAVQLDEQMIANMIDNHHKITPYRQNALVELFRQADTTDLTMGLVKNGLTAKTIQEVQKAFPNAGFHKRLLQLGLKQLVKEPLNPLPMMRW